MSTINNFLYHIFVRPAAFYPEFSPFARIARKSGHHQLMACSEQIEQDPSSTGTISTSVSCTKSGLILPSDQSPANDTCMSTSMARFLHVWQSRQNPCALAVATSSGQSSAQILLVFCVLLSNCGSICVDQPLIHTSTCRATISAENKSAHIYCLAYSLWKANVSRVTLISCSTRIRR